MASITDHITAFSVGDQSVTGTDNSGDTDAGETILPGLEELNADNSLITSLAVNHPTQYYIASIGSQGTDQQGSKENSKHLRGIPELCRFSSSDLIGSWNREDFRQ